MGPRGGEAGSSWSSEAYVDEWNGDESGMSVSYAADGTAVRDREARLSRPEHRQSIGRATRRVPLHLASSTVRVKLFRPHSSTSGARRIAPASLSPTLSTPSRCTELVPVSSELVDRRVDREVVDELLVELSDWEERRSLAALAASSAAFFWRRSASAALTEGMR